MTKEKLISLENYRANIRAKLHGEVPPKHAARPEQYKAFLSRELKLVDLKLEEARLDTKAKEPGK